MGNDASSTPDNELDALVNPPMASDPFELLPDELLVMVLVMLPFLIALAFSIWLATRPSAPAAPP